MRKRKSRRDWELRHYAYWWTLDLARRLLTIEDMCFSNRRLIDPSALYATVAHRVSYRNNRTQPRDIWLLATTEANEEWNRRPDQTYFNLLYRAVRRPMNRPEQSRGRLPPLSIVKPPHAQSWLHHWVQNKMQG